MVGATLEQNAAELELLQFQIKALTKPYLPAFGFVIGALVTYGVLRLLPGYNEACASINENLHAPRSVVELVEHPLIPGEFPFTPSRKMIDVLENSLLTKEKEIADLRKNLEQEDQELVELLAQKDEEISTYQTALEEKEKKISNLQVQADRRPYVPLARPQSSFFKEFRAQVMALEARLSQRDLHAANLQQLLAQRDQRISELEDQLSQRDLDAVNAQQLLAQRHQQVQELEARLAQRDLDTANLEESATAQYRQRITDLEAQLSQHDLDATTAQHSTLHQHNLDAANAQQSIIQLNQHVNELQAQITQCNLDHESTRQTNGLYQNQLNENQVALAEMTKLNDNSAERLKYLEGQCEKADELYRQYVKLMEEYQKLRHSQDETQHTVGLQSQVQSLQAELHTAKERISELSKSNDRLENSMNDPGRNSYLWQVRLADKDKEIAKARENCQMMQDNLESIRTTGGPSTGFLTFHHAVIKARDTWYAKAKKLEGNLYALESKAAHLQARERNLDFQLKELKNSGQRRTHSVNAAATSSMQEPTIELTVLRDIQQQREEALQLYEELVKKSGQSQAPGKRKAEEVEETELEREGKRQHQG